MKIFCRQNLFIKKPTFWVHWKQITLQPQFKPNRPINNQKLHFVPMPKRMPLITKISTAIGLAFLCNLFLDIGVWSKVIVSLIGIQFFAPLVGYGLSVLNRQWLHINEHIPHEEVERKDE